MFLQKYTAQEKHASLEYINIIERGWEGKSFKK